MCFTFVQYFTARSNNNELSLRLKSQTTCPLLTARAGTLPLDVAEALRYQEQRKQAVLDVSPTLRRCFLFFTQTPGRFKHTVSVFEENVNSCFSLHSSFTPFLNLNLFLWCSMSHVVKMLKKWQHGSYMLHILRGTALLLELLSVSVSILWVSGLLTLGQISNRQWVLGWRLAPWLCRLYLLSNHPPLLSKSSRQREGGMEMPTFDLILHRSITAGSAPGFLRAACNLKWHLPEAPSKAQS